MQEIILHIGNYKTGSSSIQSAIVNNRPKLMSEGFYVPKAGLAEGAHHDWARSWLKRPMAPKPEPLFERIRKELSRIRSDRILVSSEVLFSGEFAGDLVKALPGYKFRAICYLRRQDHFYSAFYHQLIKHPHFRESKPAEVELLRNYSCVEYLASLKRWAAAIGEEAITVFPYEKSRWNDGLLTHFFSNVGVEDPGSMQPRKGNDALNVTIHNELLEFLALANSMKFSRADHLALLGVLNKIAELPDIDNVFHKASAFSPSQRREILVSCEAENHEILRRFVRRPLKGPSTGQLFGEPEPEDDPGWRMSYLDQAALARIFASIWVTQQSQTEQLLNRISSVKEGLISNRRSPGRYLFYLKNALRSYWNPSRQGERSDGQLG